MLGFLQIGLGLLVKRKAIAGLILFLRYSDLNEKQVMEFNDFLVAFEKESARGCAVLTLCVLEDALRDLMAQRMPLASESMHRNLAPPGRLDFAIENAYLLGVLSRTEMHDFKYLVKIRNQFAHNAMLSISFDDARIASFVGNLEFPKKVDHQYKGDNRTLFAMSATMLYFALINRVNDLERITVAEEIVTRGEMIS